MLIVSCRKDVSLVLNICKTAAISHFKLCQKSSQFFVLVSPCRDRKILLHYSLSLFLSATLLSFPILVTTALAAVIEGSDSDNSLYGTMNDDVITGKGENDNLFGIEGNDDISGGSGNDFIQGDS